MKDSDNLIEVYPYTIKQLKELILAACKHVNRKVVGNSLHLIYFEEYFNKLQAKTIVVENEYIDRDFLEDFSGYYVRCFTDYEKKCKRIHFFNSEFTRDEFDLLLSCKASSLTQGSLNAGYLGFIVLKPLPQTVIGRTCLRTYEDEKRRSYPVRRKYDAHLCGLDLQVESLAFQQQDTVTAACATSALWSVFHGTSKIFQHGIPSPVEITDAATKYSPSSSRVFPNEGLTDWEMAQAIRSVGLEPYLVNPSNRIDLKAHIYAYLMAGIPLVLVLTLIDRSKRIAEIIGRHAVALTGFSISQAAKTEPYQGSNFLLKASKIDRIYAHDDGIGPFARMAFQNGKIRLSDGKEFVADFLTSSRRCSDGSIGKMIALPTQLLIPLYHKVRIKFDAVFGTVRLFDALVEYWRAGCKWRAADGRLEWDICLTTVNQYKKNLRDSRKINPDYSISLLQKHMPRFLWQATARLNDEPTIELLFDATDIEQGGFFCCAVEYDSVLASGLRAFKVPPVMEDRFPGHPVWAIFKNLKASKD